MTEFYPIQGMDCRFWANCGAHPIGQSFRHKPLNFGKFWCEFLDRFVVQMIKVIVGDYDNVNLKNVFVN